MSYCVNCGVKLDPALKQCPLCNTPVYNPREIKKVTPVNPSYSPKEAKVDSTRNWEAAILVIVILAATSASCLLLNLFVLNSSFWSLYIIGGCVLLYVALLPLITKVRIPYYLCILFDGFATAFYLFLISYVMDGRHWFLTLALPIVALVTVLAELFAVLMHLIRISVFSTAFYLFAELAVLCCGVDLLIDHFLKQSLMIDWSAIILTVCIVICIALGLIIRRSKLREELRRRLHF